MGNILFWKVVPFLSTFWLLVVNLGALDRFLLSDSLGFNSEMVFELCEMVADELLLLLLLLRFPGVL